MCVCVVVDMTLEELNWDNNNIIRPVQECRVSPGRRRTDEDALEDGKKTALQSVRDSCTGMSQLVS